MTATAHALIGASIAAAITNPYIGIPLAFFSHFLADLVPHWDAATNRKQKTLKRLKIESSIDVILGLSLGFLIFRNIVDPSYLFWMMLVSQLPDWLLAPKLMFNINLPPFTWMAYLGHKIQTRMQLPWGLVTQLVSVGAIIVISFFLSGSTLANLR
ncbi:MAG: hypothetical protein WD988_00375 [Candidatus Curtissbacteria bacterium]